jgi:hypothetical protein
LPLKEELSSRAIRGILFFVGATNVAAADTKIPGFARDDSHVVIFHHGS